MRARVQSSAADDLIPRPIAIVDVTGSEPLFQVGRDALTFSMASPPFDEWTEVFGSERLTGALLDRLTHHVNILEMNGESYRLNQSRRRQTPTAN